MKRIISMVAAFIVALAGIGIAVPANAGDSRLPPKTQVLAQAHAGVPIVKMEACQATYPGWFCLHDTASSNPFEVREPADAPRNHCFAVSPLTSYVTNYTAYRWHVYQDSGCDGYAGVIYPASAGAMNSTWNNNIRGYLRTSWTTFSQGPVADGKVFK